MASNPARKHFTYTIKDFYKEYSDSQEDPISYIKYTTLIRDFFTEIMKKIIFDKYSFFIPYNLGCISLMSRKPPIKRAPIDWAQLHAGNPKGKHFNLHTFNRLFSIKWLNSFTRRFSNKKFYQFKYTNSKLAHRSGIGGKGIEKMIMDTVNDPTKKLIK